MADKYKWNFKKYFRSSAYGWNGTAKASKRMREAVSEIKKVAKKDSALAGEGAVELCSRLYPALMYIDSSSGALGTALNRTMDALTPILISAEWDMNTRGKWLKKLFDAIQDEGWGIFDDLRDRWGEICVYPGLANLWADSLIPQVKECWLSEKWYFFVGSDMCLSCLLFTERYDEIEELLKLRRKTFWPYNKYQAMALAKQGKQEEALAYAEKMKLDDSSGNSDYSINNYCESLLIDMGRTEEAYEKYGLNFPYSGTKINIYRSICKRYPDIDKKKILIDCIEKKGEPGKWFAAAKDAGFYDIAMKCAKSSSSDPFTLLRASRDFADKNTDFALFVGIKAIVKMLREDFYEEISTFDIISAYRQIEQTAQNHGRLAELKNSLNREINEKKCKPVFRNVLLRILKNE
ncbi:hypothetical protein SMSP2_01544 [Limihaloglobus sulfuriphilus]|uniref:Uncharacterized protein n=1 Tax=Limihaloglobus sulfuriphilus TaxID=1851148 RepID=A0A1Q2MF55_9BACT|nr:hypothetical protein [Limihaloglobus sulfuriphilus]AQQ71178.1 hypothetical protein SMSP2_01544 [Limihaloglobus sulfuriphilus]